jgi:hypothetical protein
MAQLKVGDRVRRINDIWENLPVGTETVVTEMLGKSGIRVAASPKSLNIDAFELVEPVCSVKQQREAAAKRVREAADAYNKAIAEARKLELSLTHCITGHDLLRVSYIGYTTTITETY